MSYNRDDEWGKLIVETLAFNIKSLRKSRGWSQERLAEIAGVSRITITRIETGITDNPPWPLVCRIADAFGISTDDLRAPVKISVISA